MKFRRPKQHGIGLVEIMIAVLVSAILLTGVIQIYLGSKTSYRLHEAVSRVQENARLAMSFIANDVRAADFWGCGAGPSLNLVNNLNSAGANYIPYHVAVSGTEGGAGKPDSITLRYAATIGSSVTSHNLGTRTIHITSTPQTLINATTGNIAVICDPAKADIFQVTSVNAGTNVNTLTQQSGGSGPGNVPSGDCTVPDGKGGTRTAQCFSRSYVDDAELVSAKSVTYAIKPSTSSGQNGLFQNSSELAEGIEDMQILYGEDIDGDREADRYVNADKVGDMNHVTSVRISLLAKSITNNVSDQPQRYTFNGANVLAPDKNLYQVYNSTVTVRNRVL